jgi:hypothetical protein
MEGRLPAQLALGGPHNSRDAAEGSGPNNRPQAIEFQVLPQLVDDMAVDLNNPARALAPLTQYQPVRHQVPRIASGPLALSPARSSSPAASDGGILPIQDLPNYALLAQSSGTATLSEYVAPPQVDTGHNTAWGVNELRERLRNQERDAASNLSIAKELLEHRGTLVQELHNAEALANAYAERMQGGEQRLGELEQTASWGTHSQPCT